ncbi:hypothetical protein [Streptomyces halobius]|uniref:Nitrile hydratase beta subunit n=1 Tax=Streptomyces halobius TaxID=2879846 RepID=A0ABY4MFX2_9ACTN|nr:hypothetical protein [Streptomyces halobius]UQA95261.1 hypothetical protein K9S39_28460 [Streptomyces halobius]
MPKPRNPQSPHSRYREAQRITVLPLDHGLPVPDMPEGREWSEHERVYWRELWETPQASQWDDSTAGIVSAVVVYWSAILAGTASNTQHMEYRHLTKSLGLTPEGMRALGWVTGDE